MSTRRPGPCLERLLLTLASHLAASSPTRTSRLPREGKRHSEPRRRALDSISKPRNVSFDLESQVDLPVFVSTRPQPSRGPAISSVLTIVCSQHCPDRWSWVPWIPELGSTMGQANRVVHLRGTHRPQRSRRVRTGCSHDTAIFC